MNVFFEKLEKIVGHLVVPSVLLLLIVVLIEIFNHTLAEKYHTLFIYFEVFVVFIFIVDLSFKYYHLRNFPKFLRKYWLDVLVVFPFFILFKFIEEGYLLFRLGEKSYLTFKEAQVTGKLTSEINSITQSAEKNLDLIRKMNKIWPRLIRVLKIIHHKG